MSPFENEICETIAARLVEEMAKVEQTGIRRDLLIIGFERALEKLRTEPPTKQ